MTEHTQSSPNQNASELGAYGLLFLLPAMFSANMIVAKAMAGHFPPVSLAFWRWVITLLVMGALCFPSLMRHRKELLAEWKDFLILGALGMGVCGAFVYLGAETTSATNIGIIYAGSPVFIVILSATFYGERLSPLQLAGVALSLLGVMSIIVKADFANLLSLQFVVGDLWILGAASGWAVYSVLQKHRPSKLPLLVRMCGVTMGGLISLAPFTLVETMALGFPDLTWHIGLNMAVLVLISSLGAYVTYSYVQKILGASRAGIVLYLAPIYNSVMAWYLLGESLALYHYMGAAMVLTGIFMTSVKKRR